MSRNNSVQILFPWMLAVKARRRGAETARTASERHNGFASFLTQTSSRMSDRIFYFCKPTGLLSIDFLNNVWFVRHLVRISAGNDNNIISYRWRGSYRTVTGEMEDRNTHKSCRNTYLWISTVSVAPRNVHAPQKLNVSRC